MFKIEIAEPENVYIVFFKCKYLIYLDIGLLILFFNWLFILSANSDESILYFIDFISPISYALSFSLMFVPLLVSSGYSVTKKIRRKYRKYDYCIEKIEDDESKEREV